MKSRPAATGRQPPLSSGRKDVIIIPQKETQCKRIIDYLEIHESITPLEALEIIGCFRLSARIKDLREAGYIIETVMERKNGKSFAKYVLKGHKNDISD